MAVISVKETMVRDSSTEGLANQSGPAQILKFTAKREFIVTCDDVNDGPTVAAADPRIPAFGDPHPQNATIIVNAVEPKGVDGSALVFRVTVTYQRVGSVTATSPLMEPPELRVTWIPTELPSQFDVFGQLFANTAGEVFDSYTTRPWTDTQYDISYNSLTFDNSLISSHINKVNGEQWTTNTIGTRPPFTALLKGASAEMKWSLGLAYFRVTLTIMVRDRIVSGDCVTQGGSTFTTDQFGWLDVRANLGNLYLNNAGKQLQIPDEVAGLPTRNPVMLDVSGKLINRHPTPANSTFVVFYPYLPANFSQLPIA